VLVSTVANLRSLNGVAARQHGVVSREQAMEIGITRSQIAHRLQMGEWYVICSGVYAIASSPSTWEQRLTAAALSHPGSIVAGRSAAVLLGFDGFSKSRPEILMPFPGNARSPIARVIRSSIFYSNDRYFLGHQAGADELLPGRGDGRLLHPRLENDRGGRWAPLAHPEGRFRT